MTSDAYEAGGFDRDRWRELVARHVGGDRAASEELAAELAPGLRKAARSLLGHEDRDVEDVVSESVVAVLEYVRRREGFEGNLLVFGISVARNRCRNVLSWRQRRPQVPLDDLADWIAHPDRSPLDAIVEEERLQLLRDALARLGTDCQELLRAWYIEGIPVEEIRHRLGLRTIQGAYYRRARCLESAADYLNERLSGCSSHAGHGRRTNRLEDESHD